MEAVVASETAASVPSDSISYTATGMKRLPSPFPPISNGILPSVSADDSPDRSLVAGGIAEASGSFFGMVS